MLNIGLSSPIRTRQTIRRHQSRTGKLYQVQSVIFAQSLPLKRSLLQFRNKTTSLPRLWLKKSKRFTLLCQALERSYSRQPSIRGLWVHSCLISLRQLREAGASSRLTNFQVTVQSLKNKFQDFKPLDTGGQIKVSLPLKVYRRLRSSTRISVRSCILSMELKGISISKSSMRILGKRS